MCTDDRQVWEQNGPKALEDRVTLGPPELPRGTHFQRDLAISGAEDPLDIPPEDPSPSPVPRVTQQRKPQYPPATRL